MATMIHEPNAATRVYARSLFDLAMAQGGRAKVEEVADELEQVVDLARTQPKMSDLLASPTIGDDARAASLTRIFSGRVNSLTIKFLQVLNEKGRLGALPAVAASFDEVIQEKFGMIEADVYTAQPATPEMVQSLTERLARAMGKEVVVHTYTEPDMIGGVKIRIGDQLLDASIATQLRRLKDKLTQDGTSAMRAKMGRILEG
jgi:F-type H+-transporting ATPase subunit delta